MVKDNTMLYHWGKTFCKKFSPKPPFKNFMRSYFSEFNKKIPPHFSAGGIFIFYLRFLPYFDLRLLVTMIAAADTSAGTKITVTPVPGF